MILSNLNTATYTFNFQSENCLLTNKIMYQYLSDNSSDRNNCYDIVESSKIIPVDSNEFWFTMCYLTVNNQYY